MQSLNLLNCRTFVKCSSFRVFESNLFQNQPVFLPPLHHCTLYSVLYCMVFCTVYTFLYSNFKFKLTFLECFDCCNLPVFSNIPRNGSDVLWDVGVYISKKKRKKNVIVLVFWKKVYTIQYLVKMLLLAMNFITKIKGRSFIICKFLDISRNKNV